MLPGRMIIFYGNARGYILEVTPEELIWVIINTMLVYHFTDPDLGVENSFKKEGAIEKGSIDFEIGD